MAHRVDVGDRAPSFVRRPIFGLDVDSEAIVRETALAVVFLRYSAGATCRRTALELHEIWPELDLAGAALVAVTEGDLVKARDFVPRYHIRYPVLHDADGALYEEWGVERDRGFKRSLGALVSPGSWSDYAETVQVGRGLFDGPLDRLPAAFVVAPGGTIAWRWDARTVFDRVDVQALGQATLAQVRGGASRR
jgi:peroxiredoxin